MGIICPAYHVFYRPVWLLKKPDGSWWRTMDYWELIKVVTPLHAAVPNIAIILDALGPVIDVYCARLILANVSFSTPCYWVTRLICFHVWGALMDISSASLRLPSQSHNMSGHGSLRLVSVLLSHNSMAHSVQDTVLTWGLASAAEHYRLCWNVCEGKERQGTHRKFKAQALL